MSLKFSGPSSPGTLNISVAPVCKNTTSVLVLLTHSNCLQRGKLMSLIILGMDLGHVREERANQKRFGNLHPGNRVTPGAKTSSKVDAGIVVDGESDAILRWVGVNAEGDVTLQTRYGLEWLVKYQRKKALTVDLPVRRAPVIGAALATLVVVATIANAKRQRESSASIWTVENPGRAQELILLRGL
jgi:hypothetical protein